MRNPKRRLFRRVIASGVVCLILLSPSVALGWGREGHQIMAQIASRKLNNKARLQVKQLLSVKTKLGVPFSSTPDLVKASTWADDIKILKDYPREFSQLHFIENQFPKSGEVRTPNIVTALRDNVNTLRTSSDLQAKAEALRFVIHFVGDIHQPLHCAVRVDANGIGDQSGNRVFIQVADSGGRLRPDRLHGYWDAGLNTFEGSTTTTIAARIEKANPDQEPNLQIDPINFNFQNWSDESFKLAKDVAYAGIPSVTDIKSPYRVTATYRARALTVVDQQIARSGYRLAKLLNAIWPER